MPRMSKLRTVPIATPKHWENLEYHPLAELTEIDEGVDLGKIVAHMKEYGYDDAEPMVLFEAKILMGRTRHKAAVEAECVDPPFRMFMGEDATPLVLKDLIRRHLNPSQLGMAGAKLAKLASGRKKPDAQKVPESDGNEPPPIGGGGEKAAPPLVGFNPMTRVETARTLGVSVRTIDRGKVVEEKGVPALQRAVRTGKVTVADAEAVAVLPKKVQEKALLKFAEGKAKTLAEAAGIKEKKAPKPKKAKPGDAKFDWAKFDGLWKEFTKMFLDELPARFSTDTVDEKKSLQYREANRLYTDLGEVLAKWKERLTRSS